jgi:plasmid maintenance system antidote protein VapI
MARIRTHPGEVLRDEFMKPLGLSAKRACPGIARSSEPDRGDHPGGPAAR